MPGMINNNPMSAYGGQSQTAAIATQGKDDAAFRDLLDQAKAQDKNQAKASATQNTQPLPIKSFIPLNPPQDPIGFQVQDQQGISLTDQFQIKSLKDMTPSFDTRHLGMEKDELLRKKIEEFVSAAFISPLMAEARGSSLGSDRFSGGYGEDVFRGQLDQHLSGEVTASNSNSLVDAIMSQITGDHSNMARSVNHRA